MKLVTRFQAAALGRSELHGLLRTAFIVAASAHQHSQERDNALASIETIRAELASRSP
ncbi:hypothetical protein [uncultured Roseobacter sp.]|uniref:hypothetical protein n=1 Tax=uncultured Roseobacter sp. TaxID=114847 RepID=UPI002613DEC4|nr:hypothetical protein [uncultured Roseobacter sp.]